MTHNLDDITTQITNILNNDQDYQPVTFDYVSMYVHGMANIKPPYGNDAKFIQNVIDKIPRVPKTFTLEYLSNQLQTNASLNFLIHTNIFRKVVFIMHKLNKKGQIVLTVSAIIGIFLVLGGLGSLETESTSFLVAMFTTIIGLLFLILATILNSYDDTNETNIEKV